MAVETQELLTYEEVARILKCHPNTIRNLVNRGELRVVSVGWLARISGEELTNFRKRQEGKPRPVRGR